MATPSVNGGATEAEKQGSTSFGVPDGAGAGLIGGDHSRVGPVAPQGAVHLHAFHRGRSAVAATHKYIEQSKIHNWHRACPAPGPGGMVPSEQQRGHGGPHLTVVDGVVVTQDGLDGARRLLPVVMRHLRRESESYCDQTQKRGQPLPSLIVQWPREN